MKKGLFKYLKSRGLIEASTLDSLDELLDKPSHVYLGIDPTADSLHLGHLAGLSVAKWFLDYGHKVTILIGGATARVGDPSGKSLERPLLHEDEVSLNAQKLTDQVKSILQGSQNVEFVDNYSWFKNLDILSFLRDVGKHFRLGVMLSKDSVKNRLYSDEGISFTEFTYQILQGYDFFHLFQSSNVNIQIGGSDQWGNITAGTDLIRKVLKKEAYGMTFPLLTRSDGKKFGKSESGAIWLSKEKCAPYELYQYLVRSQDSDVINLLKKLSHLPLEEITQLEEGLAGKIPYETNYAQKKLASSLVQWIHGRKGLDEALVLTEGLKPGQETELNPDDLRKMHDLEKGPVIYKQDILEKKYTDLFFETGLAPSKSEAVRLFKNGGAYLNNIKITDVNQKVASHDLLGQEFLLLAAGKKKKIIIKVN
jgi:tyrosyl-tRNA synthetase